MSNLDTLYYIPKLIVKGSYILSADLVMPPSLEAKLKDLADFYFDKIAFELVVTSGLRSTNRQAIAMYENYKYNRNVKYSQANLEEEVHKAFLTGFNTPNYSKEKTINDMKLVLDTQCNNGFKLSAHMPDDKFPEGNAIDCSITSNFDVMNEYCRINNFFIYREMHCIHVSFSAKT